MSVLKFSRGTVAAFKAMERYSRGQNRIARQEIRKVLEKNPTPQDYAVAARVYTEDWRNGWFDGFEDGLSPVGNAKHFAKLGRKNDGKDWFVSWMLAYALKFRARWKGWGEMGQADAAYQRAIGLLEDDGLPKGGDAVARQHYLDVLIDRAESWIYQDRAGAAATEIARAIALYSNEKDPAKKPALEPWYYWAYAFALHQQDRYVEACTTLEPLLAAKDANNDIRLLLALSYARRAQNGEAAMKQKAADTIAEFHKNREAMSLGVAADREPRWTVQLELGCGAFLPGSPGEAHWLESLRLLLEEGKPPLDPNRPSKSGGKAPPSRVARAPKPAGKPVGKKAAAKKGAKRAVKKSPARKAAKKKAAARKRKR
ncbi:MAG TPA: hypothetical protein VHA10_23250 [Hypericibacter adhaerens]|jgi:hypothetical protein|uniref:Tetratricopeptide repeat protein n=1 Tax=Hypericibacter adhaerens TaxID=2602016 RepID=A0A5J6MTM4_9PROT|nr:hypothetical protein [Hypericibacter adhaerens]QEX20507.1 hypothetical protein FRZ61_04240 [Hypericibacter adhaerens]HWA46152.1 hypothetical protein [Hypericibacter adhaerens]